jgi:hypothetical protein
MILPNGLLLNMSSTWAEVGAGSGLNVTGNNASSFVISNASDHDIFFAKEPLDQMTKDSTYWIIPSLKKVLFWQNGPYWSVMPRRVWSAALLPQITDDFAAGLAENMMYNVLGQINPV